MNNNPKQLTQLTQLKQLNSIYDEVSAIYPEILKEVLMRDLTIDNEDQNRITVVVPNKAVMVSTINDKEEFATMVVCAHELDNGSAIRFWEDNGSSFDEEKDGNPNGYLTYTIEQIIFDLMAESGEDTHSVISKFNKTRLLVWGEADFTRERLERLKEGEKHRLDLVHVNHLKLEPFTVLVMINTFITDENTSFFTEEETINGVLALLSCVDVIAQTPLEMNNEVEIDERQALPMRGLEKIAARLHGKNIQLPKIASYCSELLDEEKGRIKQRKRKEWISQLSQIASPTQKEAIIEEIDRFFPDIVELKQAPYLADPDIGNQIGINIIDNVWLYSEYKYTEEYELAEAMVDTERCPDVELVDVDTLSVSQLNEFCEGYNGLDGKQYTLYSVIAEYGESWVKIILEMGFAKSVFPSFQSYSQSLFER